jgi:hypothetical protein
MIARFLVSATLAVALQTQLHPACAATLTSNDYAQAGAFQDQLLQLTGDVINAARATSSSSYECLTNIYTDLTIVSDYLGEVIDLIDLSVSMQTPADERTVNMTLAVNLRHARQQVANSRGAVNLSAGQCGRDSNVTEKARQALGIFSRLDGVYGMLQSKLGKQR